MSKNRLRLIMVLMSFASLFVIAPIINAADIGESKSDNELVIGPMEAEQILKMFKQPEKTESNNNSKLLEMLEFAMEGLRESESEDDFKANLKLMKRILNKY